jgi:PKD domain.
MNIETTSCTFPQSGENINDPGNGGQPGDGGEPGGGGGGTPGEGNLIIQESPEQDGNATYTIEGTYQNINTRFDWQLGDGTTKLEGGRTVQHSYAENGRYDVSCQVRDGVTGNEVDFMETTVRVVGLPSDGRDTGESDLIEVVEPPGRDGQGTFRITGEYNAAIKNFIWDMDESDSEGFSQDKSGREITHTFDSSGTYFVRGRVSDGFGTILASGGTEVVVNLSGDGPGEGAEIEGPSIVVEGLENTWSISNGQSGEWEMGDGETYTNQSEVTHTYEFQGPYTITYSSGGFVGIGEYTTTFNVQVEPNVDDGPVGGLSVQPPSMDEAADSKDRNF